MVMLLGFIHDLLGKDNCYFSLIVLHIPFQCNIITIFQCQYAFLKHWCFLGLAGGYRTNLIPKLTTWYKLRLLRPGIRKRGFLLWYLIPF